MPKTMRATRGDAMPSSKSGVWTFASASCYHTSHSHPTKTVLNHAVDQDNCMSSVFLFPPQTDTGTDQQSNDIKKSASCSV
jgi:hypothetical protein